MKAACLLQDLVIIYPLEENQGLIMMGRRIGKLPTIAQVCEYRRVYREARNNSGYRLANAGYDTRAIQHYMGHKNIQHTVRYTELSAARLNGFWRD